MSLTYTPGKLVLKKDSVAVDPNTDPNFANVSLLLYGNGINGSTSIIDSSPSPKTVTAFGNAQISTAQSKFGGSSIAFDGTGDYLTVPDNDNFALGNGNFTIECWIYNNTTGGFRHIVGQGSNPPSTINKSFYFFKSNTNKLVGSLASGTTSYDATSSADLPLNSWTHVAFVRNGNTTFLYINGSVDGTASVTGVTVNNSANQLGVGSAGEFPTDTWNGYIADLRITKGVARYNAAFTPPTAPFPNYGGDADANAYMSAVEAADGQPLELATRLAITDFVVGCKADGIWTAIKASCILSGARTLAGALIPLVGTAPTNFNFASGDYNRKTGLVGDASTKYLNSNRNNNADPQDSNHNAAFVSIASPISTHTIMGANDAGGAPAGGNVIVQSGLTRNRSSTSTTVSIPSQTTGLFGTARSLSSSYAVRANGQAFTANVSSNGLFSANIEIFRRQGFSNYFEGRIAFYSIGESLNLELLDTRVTTLINAFAAAIP
jgi:hypothetical protein